MLANNKNYIVMKNLELKKYGVESMSSKDLQEVEGGSLLAFAVAFLIAGLVGYIIGRTL